MDWTDQELQKIVDDHSIVLFMKGTPGEPQCGFSNRAAQVLQQLGEEFAAVNVLTDRRAILQFALGQISLPCHKFTSTVS